MPKRFFLQKLATYSGESLAPGYFVSEKFDGIRALWDGGVTRGMLKKDIPWANTIRDARFVETQYATGLWSQYGHPIFAPDWWLDRLPAVVCEGELYAGRGCFQDVQSIARKQTAISSDWDQMRFMPFDMPNVSRLFANGKVTMLRDDVWFRHTLTFFIKHAGDSVKYLDKDLRYEQRRYELSKHFELHPEQFMNSKVLVQEYFNEIVEAGGEGVIIKSRNNIWTPHREKDCFKLKPWLEDEATVVGFIAGEGKFEDMIGAYICDYKGIRLELSGMTNSMRELLPQWLPYCDPKKELPKDAQGMYIKTGNTVTFRYRELSRDGIPKEARFIRKREDL